MLAFKLALLTFIKARKVKSTHFQIDSTTALEYLLKTGEQKTKAHIFKQRDMGLSVFSGHHHYSKISSRCNEYSGRLPAKTGKRPLRMEIESPSFSQDLLNIWKTRDIPICISSLIPSFLNILHGCQTRSVRAHMQCNKIGQRNYCMCFPFFVR